MRQAFSYQFLVISGISPAAIPVLFERSQYVGHAERPLNQINMINNPEDSTSIRSNCMIV